MYLIDYNFYSFPVAFFNLIAYNRIRIKKSVKIFHSTFIWLTNSPIIYACVAVLVLLGKQVQQILFCRKVGEMMAASFTQRTSATDTQKMQACKTPEICSLITLAACFANIYRGIIHEDTFAQIDDDSGEYERIYRQMHVLKFDLFWEMLGDQENQVNRNAATGQGRQVVTDGVAVDSDKQGPRDESESIGLLEQLCALSDYYAAVLRGLPATTRAKSGLITDELAQEFLGEILLYAGIPVTSPNNYPMVDDSVFWERWDFEPASAFKWFKQYLKMSERFGFRDFEQFEQYLQRGTAGIIDSLGKQHATVAEASAGLNNETDDANDGVGGILSANTFVSMQELLRIRAYYHIFYWETRCEQYDKWERDILKARAERRTTQLLDTQYTAFNTIFCKIQKRVEETVDLLDPNDAVKALQDIAKMVRLSAGFIADKPFIGNDGNGNRVDVNISNMNSNSASAIAAANQEVTKNREIESLLEDAEARKLLSALYTRAHPADLEKTSES